MYSGAPSTPSLRRNCSPVGGVSSVPEPELDVEPAMILPRVIMIASGVLVVGAGVACGSHPARRRDTSIIKLRMPFALFLMGLVDIWVFSSFS